MKVIFVSGSYPPVLGGVGDYTYKIHEEMKRQLGADKVYSITAPCESRTSKDPYVLDVVERWDLRGVRLVLRAIREIRPDVVHIQYPFYARGAHRRCLYASLLPFLLRILQPRIRVFGTIHEFDNKTLKGKLRLLMSMVFCNGIVIVNESYRNHILRFCPFLSRRMTYIPIGSNISNHEAAPSRKHEIRKTFDWAKSDPILAYFGILRDGKGLDDLIDSFLTARKTNGNLRLLLIGGVESGFHKDTLLDRLRTADAAKSVVLTGRVSEREASEYLATADVSVLPYEDGVSTKRGGFMAAVEHGRPIITTRPTNKMDELHDGENVLLITTGDVPELTKKIHAIVNDQNIQETLRQTVVDLKQIYSWETITKKHVVLYKVSNNCSCKRDNETNERTERR